ncbi:retrovirus-related pol polyprotein from transposon TNT 1-94, partial [Tanacetum coccineum]
MKNKKVEVYPRNVKSSLNKTNGVSVCNQNVKHGVLNVNSEYACSTCNEVFSVNHDMCVDDYLNDVNAHTRAKSVKSIKKNEWKPTGKVVTNVGHKCSPTRRTFTIVGTKCPLTRVTSTKIVPPRKPAQTIALLFLWAEAVATACYTQNRSLIRTRHNKTPYELMHEHKPDLKYFYVFGALCYPINDCEDLGKRKPKADIDIFIGFSPTKKAYQIYNKRTRMIMETIHVEFDELIAMDFEQFNLGPE